METLRGTLPLSKSHHVILYTTTATAFIALLAYSSHCYAEWYALGEGGVPRTVRGWLKNVAAHLIARRDHRVVPAPYERIAGKGKGPKSKNRDEDAKTQDKDEEHTTLALSAREEEIYDVYSRTSFLWLSSPSPSLSLSLSISPSLSSSWAPVSLPSQGQDQDQDQVVLGPIPQRDTPRPTVPTTVFPQRQTTETASEATVARQVAYLRALAAANPHLFAMQPSGLESPKFEALWLRSVPAPKPKGEEQEDDDEQPDVVVVDPSAVKWLPSSARGEIAHVHLEGSGHACLSLVDAAEVVRRGWGERHMLAGVPDMLPWGYVLLYAPREDREDDWAVWQAIVLAAARVVARCAGFVGEVVVPGAGAGAVEGR
ncbi:hypothetical protein F5X97DRAFT_274736 [Nemania serpens]|nr:hypothetical protein F5X97DRAFT_274736 [Nemania serpens]